MTDRKLHDAQARALRRRQVLTIYCVCAEADEAGATSLKASTIDAALVEAGLPPPVDDRDRNHLMAAAHDVGEILTLGQAALKDCV